MTDTIVLLEERKEITTFIKVDTKENVALYKCYYDKEPWEVPLETDEDSFLNVSDEFLNQVLRIGN